MIKIVIALTLLESSPQLVVLLFEPFCKGWKVSVFCPSHFVNSVTACDLFFYNKLNQNSLSEK